MKKILFVCAGRSFPQGAFVFLESLQKDEPVFARGLFFSPINNEDMATASQVPGSGAYLRVKEKEKKIVQENKAIFIQQCEARHIKHQVHVNDEEWDKDLLAGESRFADLVLVSGEVFYAELEAGQPNVFLHEALHSSECPVLIVPEGYTDLKQLVIAYDGSRESLYSLKQFCYLLPQHTGLPTEIIYVKNEEEEGIPDLESLQEYSRLHFGNIHFSKLHFDPDQYFATWIGEKKHTLLVSGSFGRSSLSYMSRHSFAKQVIRDHKMPVFIAHP